MRKCLTFSLVLILLIPFGAFSDTVTQNGGFETGDFTGWDVWVSAVYPVEFSITTESHSGLYAAKGSIDESGECGSLEQNFTVPQNATFSFYYKANMQAGNDIYYDNYRILSGWSLYDLTTDTQITQDFFDHKTEYALVSYDLSAFSEHDVKFRIYVGSDEQCEIPIDPPYELLIDDVYCIPKNLLPVAEAGGNQTVVVDNIVYFNGSASYDPDGTIISYDWDFGDGSPNGTGPTPTHIYTSPGTYTVILIVTDADGMKGNDTCIIKVLPPTMSLSLEEGWNLISLPRIQSESEIQSILSSIDEDYDALQWYNAQDVSDPWKCFHIQKPTQMNDLKDLDHCKGIWIHIIAPGGSTLLLDGENPTTTQHIPLYPGWNLVGYPSQTCYNRTDGLNNLTFGIHVDSIWTHDDAIQRWDEIGPSDFFEIGKGYWIHAKTKCVWEVPI